MMTTTQKALWGGVFVLALMGCSKEAKQEPLKALSPEQLDQLESVTRSMDQADEAVQRAKTAGG